jgi:hypothetical protein
MFVRTTGIFWSRSRVRPHTGGAIAAFIRTARTVAETHPRDTPGSGNLNQIETALDPTAPTRVARAPVHA